MKPKTVTNIIDDSESNKVLIVTNANHTISDTESYSLYVFTGLTASRYLYFPTCTSHPGKEFTVINDTGTYNVICTPSGTDAINSYNAAVDITELHGWWKFKSQTTEWRGITDGNSTIYKTSSTSIITPVGSTSNTWYDVTAIQLDNLPCGKYELEGMGHVNWANTSLSEYVYLYLGIGTATGDVAPSIIYERDQIRSIANHVYGRRAIIHIFSHYYSNSVETTDLYLKVMYVSDEASTDFAINGAATVPIYISARRIS